MSSTLLSRLRQQPDALPSLLFGLSDSQIQQRPETGKWSIFENLAHLGRYQDVLMERLERILREDKPVFTRYVADEDPAFTEWTRFSLSELLERTQATRATIHAFLSNLTKVDYARLGFHPAYGPMTLEGWVEFFLLHEAHHFFTIMKLGGPLRITFTEQ